MPSTKLKIFVAANCFVAGFLIIGLYFHLITPAPPLCNKGHYSFVSLITEILRGHTRDRWIIYVCDYGKSCGELPLRLDGIMSTYLFSVLSARKLGILFSKPVPLQDILRPVKPSWIVEPSALVFGSCNYYDHTFDNKFADKLRTADLDWEFPEQVVYVKLSRYHWNSLYENSRYQEKLRVLGYTSSGTFHHAFVKLFEPQPKFEKSVWRYSNQFKSHSSTDLVCVLTEMDQAGAQKLSHKGETIWHFLDRFALSNRTQILLRSGSPDLAKESKKRFGHKVAVLARSRRLIDADEAVTSSGESLRENLETHILDFYTLSQCDRLVIECGSDFGRMVAYFRNVNQDLYYIQNGTVREIDLDALSMDYEEGRCLVRITRQMVPPVG